ncbi:MAG: exodeoxyribonuclease VII small subunit [Bacteroidales bacterium]|nr:exodeoxyribonuclease VII small subunit [Bacteroidales bacterium]
MIDASKFDYAAAQAELEEILKAVENPETAIDDIDAKVKRADELIKACREYLRSAEDRVSAIDA